MIEQFELHAPTPKSWTECVMTNFSDFLIDHAACEKKAAGMATSMISHYPDRQALVTAMCDLAVEEMMHFREVTKLIHQQGLILAKDEKDPYIAQLRDNMTKGKQAYFLDRLLVGSVVEARGAERFALVAQALALQENQALAQFYKALAQSESRHYTLFLKLAYCYFDDNEVAVKLEQWLKLETKIMLALAIRPALH